MFKVGWNHTCCELFSCVFAFSEHVGFISIALNLYNFCIFSEPISDINKTGQSFNVIGGHQCYFHGPDNAPVSV